MILVSVGTQLPFDRLIRAVDQWTEQQGRNDIIAQIGPTTYEPRALESFAFMENERFRQLQMQASLMVSHAGMGSIITALELGIPIIILARDHRLGEHRNGHQLATLQQFRHFPGVYAADDETTLLALLDQSGSLTSPPHLASSASDDFIKRLHDYMEQPPATSRLRGAWQRLRSA